MSQPPRRPMLPSPLIALAGWLVPGAGYVMIGHRARGLIVLVCIVTLYLLGLLIAGVRVVEVPGYGKHGYRTLLISTPTRNGFTASRPFDPSNREESDSPPVGETETLIGWSLPSRFMPEISAKPWFLTQILAGPLALLSAAASNWAAQAGIGRVHAPLETVGTLYTAIAGMLNLYIIIDSTYRASLAEI